MSGVEFVASLLPRLAGGIDGATGEAVSIHAPWTGEKLGELPTHTAQAVDTAVAAARRAQREWAARGVRSRARVLERFGELVLARQQQILDVIQAENGKSRLAAQEEVLDVALLASHYAATAPAVLRTRRRMGALPVLTSTTEHRLPKGVVGIIAPWNYPFTLAVGDALAALLAGNAVVLKPDSRTPYSALMGLALLREAGVPREVMQVVFGPGRVVGERLIDLADFIMFTGSTATGRHIAARCGGRLIGFSGELGGKNPLLVLSDADVSRAAEGAVRASFANAGQLCVSIERIYVVREVAERFTREFVAAVQRLRLGAGRDWEVQMGSIIAEDHLKVIEEHVADAVAKGATVLTGGKRREDLGPLFYEPKVLTDVPEEAELFRAETFGPVVSIYVVDSDEEAIRLANDTEYGLNASVWSTRPDARRIAGKVAAGTVNINEGYSAAWASHGAPMGGMKASGVGRRHGTDGLLKYTESQSIARQRLLPIGSFPGMSEEGYSRVITGLARSMQVARKVGSRLLGR